jgi:hypothetical protein
VKAENPINLASAFVASELFSLDFEPLALVLN